MRRAVVLASVVLVGMSLLFVIPDADAALPISKDWKWVDDVQGTLHDVDVCRGEDCGSNWASASTENSAGGGSQANLYSYSRAGQRAWSWNVEAEGSDEADFRMTSTAVDDQGELVAGASNKRANQGLLNERTGPFWARESPSGGDIAARADADSSSDPKNIENADSDNDDQKLIRWLPGNRDAFVMARDPSAAGQAFVWAYEVQVSGSDDPLGDNWDMSGEELPANDIVDLAVNPRMVVVAQNGDSGANVTILDVEDPSRRVVADADHGNVRGTITAMTTARDSLEIVLGTDDGTVYVIRALIKDGTLQIERLAERIVDDQVDTVAISADGSRFAVGGSFGIRSFRLTGQTDQPVQEVWSWSNDVDEIRMSQDGRYLVSSRASALRFFWNQPPGDRVPLWKNQGMQGRVEDIATGYGGEGTVVGTDAGKVYYFDLDHDIKLTLDRTDRKLEPGENNNYTMVLENTGDAVNDVQLDASGPQSDWVKFKPADGSAKSTLTGLTLLPEETRTIKIQVRPDAGTAAGTTFDAKIEAAVTSAPGKVSRTRDITGTVEESYGVIVTSDPGSANVRLGESKEFNLTITNAGNLQDTILVDVGPLTPGWRGVVSKERFSLAAGESDFATLTVTAPDQGQQGSTETVAVNGVSQGNPSETGQARIPVTIGRSSGARIDAPGNLEARAGTANRYTVTVNNTGNTVSTLELSLQAPGRWTVSLSETQVRLDPGASQALTLTIRPPSDAQGAGTVKITAVAADDPDTFAERSIIVNIDRGFLGLPGFGTALLVAASTVAAAAVARRRT